MLRYTNATAGEGTRVDGESLSLVSAEGTTVASFTRVAKPLTLALGLAEGCGGDEEAAADGASSVGVPWVLSGSLNVDGWKSVVPSATFTDSRVGGSTGCNRFSAMYTFEGDSLESG